MFTAFYPVLCTQIANVAVAAEAVPEAAEASGEPGGWVSILIAVLATVVVPFITNYLKKAAEAKKAELDVAGLDKKQKIAVLVQAYALERAEAYAERDILTLAKMIAMGEIKDTEKVKAYLKGLGARLRDDLVVFAKEQFGVDLLAEYGAKLVDGWIESAANRVSPFPGKDTAEALLKGGANSLVKHGVKRLQKMVVEEETDPVG